MTKEQVQQKLVEMKQAYEQAAASVHAHAGAVQALEQLLAEWDKPQLEVLQPKETEDGKG